jgi:hypothetical protein
LDIPRGYSRNAYHLGTMAQRLPSRSEAIRRLIEIALATKTKRQTRK